MKCRIIQFKSISGYYLITPFFSYFYIKDGLLKEIDRVNPNVAEKSFDMKIEVSEISYEGVKEALPEIFL